MRTLLKCGANISNADKESTNKSSNKYTLFHYAAERGWTSVTRQLIKHQSIPALYEKDKEGFIPLELAICKGHNECATLLVQNMEPVRYR